MNNNNILCDHKECPLKDNCARFLENIDRTKTFHVDPTPYKNSKCFLYEPMVEDDLIEKVTNIINRRMN